MPKAEKIKKSTEKIRKETRKIDEEVGPKKVRIRGDPIVIFETL